MQRRHLVEKMRIDYTRFKLAWESDSTYERHNVYQRLIRKFENDGFTESIEKISVEYDEFKYDEKAGESIVPVYWNTVNWLDKKVSDYSK